MNICISVVSVVSEAYGIDEYRGAREKTDALTFKKAASPSREK